jgi:universal stress protein A
MDVNMTPNSRGQTIMHTYKTILCAIDFSDDNHRLIEAALELTDTAHIHLAHACEHPITGYGELTGRNHQTTEHQIRQAAYPPLVKLAEHFGIIAKQAHIEFGRPSDVVVGIAESLSIDLLVIGSHGHSGLRALLGSTANSIIHSAECNVLTVRINQ